MLLLCVDDDPDDIELFLDAIKTLDPTHTCVVAENGREALEMLEYLRPDIIFLDINMPVLDGNETLQLIQKDDRLQKIPVYMLSTTIDEDNSKMLKRMGATTCMEKPSSFDELCARLEEAIVKHKVNSANNL